MHMSDALISPLVGGAFWVVAAGSVSLAGRGGHRVAVPVAGMGGDTPAGEEGIDPSAPLVGLMGAFVFAAQMVNFAIPGTGSSGHLTGGLLLALLLGPRQALLAMTALITIQALFFADGGLLALGCNIVNMGVIPCLVVYPLAFRPLAGGARPASTRWRVALYLSALLALLLGAAGVVLATTLSGMGSLPWRPFAVVMLGIHLAIGLVEGAVTVGVAEYALRAGLLRPDAITPTAPPRPAIGAILAVTLLLAGVGSWFAATAPDGLAWSVDRVAGKLQAPAGGLHATAAHLQERVALMPEYGASQPWGVPDVKKSGAGLLGGMLTLFVAAGLSWLIRQRREKDPAVMHDQG
ncbi:MAG: energy-coupling factor ABC transporter permease [Magnetococcales bacterium]|nr:energy-coupling factor ABC transporter permease [Magnetococcales bacterium]